VPGGAIDAAADVYSLIEARRRTRLARRLRRDLDAIVMKALAKAPIERHEAAAALAADPQRYLRGQAVQARPDRFAYRLIKVLPAFTFDLTFMVISWVGVMPRVILLAMSAGPAKSANLNRPSLPYSRPSRST
jgi:eukaryotic-like serine/threonine-protein kinase